MYLLFIHRIQFSCNDHIYGDANHSNNNSEGNDDGNRNGNVDGDGSGDGGCDYNANNDTIAMDVGISLVMAEEATTAAVISMTVVIYCQEQAGSRVTNTNSLENNRCNYLSCVVVYNF